MLLFLFAFGFEPFASPDPQAWQRSWILRYGAAVLAVVAFTLIRAALTPLMGPEAMPFTLYFCAVAFAAWFGGFRPALLSIVLSLLAGAWFFAAPTKSLWVSGHDDQVAMLLLVLVGFGLALLARAQRTAVERALRAESSERIERQRFETTLGSIGDAVIATDPMGRVTFANPVALQLTAWTEAEIGGKQLDEIFRIVNEATRKAVESPVARVLREGVVVGLANHTILIARDGTEVPIDDSAAPIRGANDELLGVVLVFRDISEKRSTENLLAAQSAELRRRAEIMEHAQVCVRDMDDRVRYWNEGAEQLYGFTAEEALGQISHVLFHTQFPAPLETIRAELLSDGKMGRRVGPHPAGWQHGDGGEPLDAASECGRASGGHPGSEPRHYVAKADGRGAEPGTGASAARAHRGKDGRYEVELAGKAVWWSPETYLLFGLSTAEFKPTRDGFAGLIHTDTTGKLYAVLEENIAEFNP